MEELTKEQEDLILEQGMEDYYDSKENGVEDDFIYEMMRDRQLEKSINLNDEISFEDRALNNKYD